MRQGGIYQSESGRLGLRKLQVALSHSLMKCRLLTLKAVWVAGIHQPGCSNRLRHVKQQCQVGVGVCVNPVCQLLDSFCCDAAASALIGTGGVGEPVR